MAIKPTALFHLLAWQTRAFVQAQAERAREQAEPVGETPPAEPQPVKRGPGRPRKAA